MDDRTYTCPLCSHEFSGASCHSSCPMSRGCSMVMCPNCRYEFVEDSVVVDFVRSLIRRVRHGVNAS